MPEEAKRELLEQRLWEMQLLVDQMMETSDEIGYFVARLRGNPHPSKEEVENLPNEILDDRYEGSEERKRLIMTAVMLRSYANHVRLAYLACLEILTGDE